MTCCAELLVTEDLEVGLSDWP